MLENRAHMAPTNIRWRDIPDDAIGRWRSAFEASTAGLDVAGACPVCRARDLHRWFDLHRSERLNYQGRSWAGHGSEWQWCSNCGSYEHTTGLVPAWWHSDFVVAEDELQHDPEPIERARRTRTSSAGDRG